MPVHDTTRHLISLNVDFPADTETKPQKRPCNGATELENQTRRRRAPDEPRGRLKNFPKPGIKPDSDKRPTRLDGWLYQTARHEARVKVPDNRGHADNGIMLSNGTTQERY